jgi:quercetin dioxygenase-like cupin family protein
VAKFLLCYFATGCLFCLIGTAVSINQVAATIGREKTMDIHPSGSRPSRRGPADSFTGVVWQDPIVEAPAPARLRSGFVRFEPGARTHWHTHPLGQTLCVTFGVGRVQVWGGKAREIRPGDVVWIPPHEKHWHGAGPSTVMVHIAMQEALDGKHVEWLEPVSDEQYKAAAGS